MGRESPPSVHPPAHLVGIALPANMITTLPSEILQNIAAYLYAPLRMTQADRFAWNIFSSFGDNPPSRRQGLADLVSLGATCRALWSEVRPSLFRCIRVADDEHLEAIITAKDDWAKHVRSIVIDMSLFESDERQTWDRGRNPWYVRLATDRSPRADDSCVLLG